MGDQAQGKAGSSFAAGKTYDGAAPNNISAIGPDGSAIGMDGADTGTGAQPKAFGANSSPNVNKQETIPTPPAKDVTPWANQLMIGMALGGAAVAALMFAASIIKKAKVVFFDAMKTAAFAAGLPAATALTAYQTQVTLARVIIGAAIAAALGGVMMGAMIAGGQNGQTLQGGLLIASSAAIVAAGTGLLMTTLKPMPLPGDVAEEKVNEKLLGFGVPGTWMYIIGGMGAVGLVGTMMAPKKTCKSDQEGCHAYYQQQRNPTNYTV
jgi:hypothetical protein